MLVEELRGLDLRDAAQDEHGIVLATIPSTSTKACPVIAWIAHVDTSPETSGRNVKPIVHRDYDGKDIALPGDPSKVIRVAECPDLARLTGRTIITTDGTTLLGSDDKSGVAVIMETASFLVAHPEIEHGSIRICFTCDEEIGRGVDHLDLTKLGADVGYTLDGAGVGEIDGGTFSADLAVVKISGVNIHPSIAKGRMVNAVRLAGMLLDRLPRQTLSPETTADREGFLHPYRIEGGVAETTVRILLRDFDTERLKDKANLLHNVGRLLSADYPAARIDVAITPQYRNMSDGLRREPRAVAFAQEAMRRAELEPKLTIVRGGTDGSRLTEMGLPTPNLSTGEHNIHSPLEWTCLEEMEIAARVLVELARVWRNEAKKTTDGAD
jgi:tripeptide aminopeptidase